MDLLAAVAQDVVPDGFQAVGRNREGHTGGHAFDSVAAGHQCAVLGIEPGGIVDALRRRSAAVGRKHPQLVVRALLQQGLVPRSQQLGVLL
ncbi:hypothetical protein D3C84_816330 [compost metagenome]